MSQLIDNLVCSLSEGRIKIVFDLIFGTITQNVADSSPFVPKASMSLDKSSLLVLRPR